MFVVCLAAAVARVVAACNRLFCLSAVAPLTCAATAAAAALAPVEQIEEPFSILALENLVG